MIVVGIDPGVSGAIAHIYANGDACVESVPTISLDGGGRDLDFSACLGMLHYNEGDMFAYIENVWGQRGWGIQASCKLVGTRYAWQALCGSLDIPTELVLPRAWQGELDIVTAKKHPRSLSTKEQSIEIAHGLFPFLAADIGKDHNRADALLIAEYGRRQHK